MQIEGSKNDGYNFKMKHWTQAEGLAKFTKDKNIAKLKVDFVEPFTYIDYSVIYLDTDY